MSGKVPLKKPGMFKRATAKLSSGLGAAKQRLGVARQQLSAVGSTAARDMAFKIALALFTLGTSWATWYYLNKNENTFTDNGYNKNNELPWNKYATPIMLYLAITVSVYYANMARMALDSGGKVTHLIIGFALIAVNIILIIAGYTLITNQGKIEESKDNKILKSDANSPNTNYGLGSFDIALGAGMLALTLYTAFNMQKEGKLIPKRA
jgi:hypothetical protein